ncbi:MAG: M23 family metallopeptidase [Patescibacteria group bacterium]
MDIAAPIGTAVHASFGGIVLATGNTDLVRGCYSYGKWIMLVHGNGLNTLYAHLSEIDVAKGQAVSTGQMLGLSGMTGYATGPHLHFGVYATEGTQIMTLRQFRGAKIGCADATMPVATLTAYLNPLSYL